MDKAMTQEKHYMKIKRIVFFLFTDILSVVAAFYLARDLMHFPEMVGLAPVFFASSVLLVFSFFKLYRITWRYVSIKDLYNIFVAHVVTCFALIVTFALLSKNFPAFTYPLKFFFLETAFSFLFISSVRVAKRLYLEVLKNKYRGKGLRTLILGAGHSGEMILRDMARHSHNRFFPIAFLDDDTAKKHTFLHGIKVLGSLQLFEKVVADYQIEAVIIAIPTLQFAQMQAIYDSIKKNKQIKVVKTVPRIYDYDSPDFRLKDLEDISIEDLIGRQVVEVDFALIKDFLSEKVVLVTGAGGSIGSEIVTQVCAFNPHKIILFDVDETELHNLSLKLKKRYPHFYEKLHYVVGDVRDELRVREIFQKYLPQVVFHAAAYKHVPMMEENVREAIKVNIFGTENLARAATEFAAEKFVMISTDKAVRPTSVMGATKRLAERVCKAYGEASGTKTEFVSVRFGNVLGSRGSALPLFMDQIRAGGPITITHHEMKRYFMTIPEAVTLVLQASAVGRDNEVMVLDMGEPVLIVKLAEDLIRLQGFEPYQDIDIEFIGLRPGEKLFEELLTAEEGTIATKHNRVFVARESTRYTLKGTEQILDTLREIVASPLPEAELQSKQFLRANVQHYGTQESEDASQSEPAVLLN